jgi:hypothetical protein
VTLEPENLIGDIDSWKSSNPGRKVIIIWIRNNYRIASENKLKEITAKYIQTLIWLCVKIRRTKTWAHRVYAELYLCLYHHFNRYIP